MQVHARAALLRSRSISPLYITQLRTSLSGRGRLAAGAVGSGDGDARGRRIGNGEARGQRNDEEWGWRSTTVRRIHQPYTCAHHVHGIYTNVFDFY
ncbi:hypothetical protein [Oryza sativa Japonica Group]|uniref:Uncharacterized protein n=2 Tax=Oryza sativa subsp. japonica TaxID=39947 RepID=Q657V2_ORYSJ|nr:hypothetical protein [Oryza sativa Japonica Group]BAD44925.1 hypothetical protein [Oryza sativa Japonica Group]